MDKNNVIARIKKILLITIFLIVTLLTFYNIKKVILFIEKSYFLLRIRLGTLISNVILICMISILCILICVIIGKRIDKKLMYKNEEFSERHPYLNMIISVSIILIIIAIFWVILYCLFYEIEKLVVWIVNMASKIDAVVIVALITGTVSLIGVIISSIVAKIIDYRKARQEYLAKKREIPYGEFIEMIYKIQENEKNGGKYTESMILDDLSKFSKQITLWGSSQVVNKWVEFRENGANPNAGTNTLFLMEDIINEMRKDLGMKRVKKGRLLAFFINDIKNVLDKRQKSK